MTLVYLIKVLHFTDFNSHCGEARDEKPDVTFAIAKRIHNSNYEKLDST